MGGLTKAMRACLEYYRDNEHNPDRLQLPPYHFTIRQVNRALDFDYLKVGPGGWHILTPAGRAALEPAHMTSDQERAAPAQQPVSPSDPQWIIAGIRQFGLAPDGSDLRDLEAALTRSEPELRAETVSLTRERDRHLRGAARHFAKSCELADRALTAEEKLTAAESRVEALSAEVGTARAAAFEEAAQIADGHARNAWEIAVGKGEDEICASGRHYAARDIEAAIRSRAFKGGAE